MSKLGVVSNVDAKDLPNDYAVYNKNVDPIQINGRLKPIKTHSVISGATKAKTATKGAWLQNGTEQTTLVFTDGTNLEQTNDWYGSLAEGTQIQAAFAPTSMEIFNKEIHCGNGTGTPKWVGFIQHKQFGGSVNTALQIQDAECSIGESYQSLSKVSTDGTYLYGVTHGGKNICKFNFSTKALVKKSTYLLDYTISLCVDGTYIWLLHQRGSTYYVAKFNNNFELIIDAPLSSVDNFAGTVPESDCELYDIEKSDGYLWISQYSTVSSSVAGFYRFVRPTTNNTITLNKIVPYSSLGHLEAGKWDDFYDAPSWIFPKKPLTSLYSDAMCVAFKMTNWHPLVPTTIPHLYTSTPASVQVTGGLFYINDDYVGGVYDGTNLEIFGLSEVDAYDVVQLIASYGTSNRRVYKYNSSTSNLVSYPMPTTGVYGGTDYMPIEGTNGVTLVSPNVYVFPINTTGTSITVNLFKQQSPDWYEKVNSTTGTWGSETAIFKSKVDITFKDMTTDSTGLLSTKAYFYAVSYVFDDIQHSPLSTIFRCNLGTVKQKEVTIKLKDTTGGVFNKKRVTAINLYRAENDAGAPVKETLMRFVASFDIRESFPLIDSDYYQIVYVDDGNSGATFEAMTEFPEELETTMVNHYFSTTLGGYRYIAKCTKTELPDASQIIFRSKLNAYDTFDWTTDLMRVPYVPLAIKGFNNRLFVFFENMVMRYHPDLYPEEDYKGIGIYSGLEPLVTDEGMFWMDANGIYVFDGSKITDISIPIKDTADSNLKSYKNTIVTGTQRCMAYSAEKKSVLFSALNSSTGSIWAFHIESQQWYYWEHGSVTSYYMFNGRKAEVFLATTGNFRKMFDGSTYENSEIITKKYDVGSSKQKKKWYKVKSRTSGTVTFYKASDDGTSFSSFSEDLSKLVAYNLQIKATTTGDSYIDSMEIICRRMVGYR